RVTLDGDRLCEPLIVLHGGLMENIDHMIEATCFDAVSVRVVHLNFTTLRGEMAGCSLVAANVLKFSQHVDAAVRPSARHDIYLQFEIAEAVVSKRTVVVGMTRLTVCDDRAVTDCEGFGRSANFPAGKVLPVEQARKSRFDRRSAGTGGCGDRHHNKHNNFHHAEVYHR